MSRKRKYGIGVLPEGALIDPEDSHLLEGRVWSVGGRWYVKSSCGEYLHRLIFPDAIEVDHRDGNGLDNRRENLRPCTTSQNQGNQRPQVGRSSRFKGVSWAKRESKWYVRIQVDGRVRSLGMFSDEVEAAKAYNSAALEAWGEFALINDLEA